MEERSSFALLVGTVVDATTVPAPYTPTPPRTPISVAFDGIGTPPIPTQAISSRTFSQAGFVLSFDAADVAVDDPTSSGPSPKHLSGAFDVHFTISAEGYTDLSSTYACSHDVLPITPPAFALQPVAVVVQGRVTAAGSGVAGATVQITAESPAPGSLPPATATDANGMYVFAAVPAAQTITISASGTGGSAVQTVSLDYPATAVAVNLSLS